MWDVFEVLFFFFVCVSRGTGGDGGGFKNNHRPCRFAVSTTTDKKMLERKEGLELELNISNSNSSSCPLMSRACSRNRSGQLWLAMVMKMGGRGKI